MIFWGFFYSAERKKVSFTPGRKKNFFLSFRRDGKSLTWGEGRGGGWRLDEEGHLDEYAWLSVLE